MKAVNLAIESMLPPNLRRPDRIYTKKNLDKLLNEVALQYPDKYAGIVKSIADLGRHGSYYQGETLRLKDFRPVIDKDGLLKQMDAEVKQAQTAAKNPAEAEKARLLIWSKYAGGMEKSTTDAALAQHNNLGNAVVSGARGNPTQLKAMVTTPGLYTDYKDRIIPMFVRHSFGEGLRPAEYLASSYGVRKGVIGTKTNTAEGGDMLKQLTAALSNVVVTTEDCGTTNGLDYAADDPEIEGRVAAKDYGDIKAGDVLDHRKIAKLQRQGVKNIIVRSPMTCQAKDGICAHCLGTLNNGEMPPIGYFAGGTAASALGEPRVQGALNCLAEGTLVRMANGKTKCIEKIKVGDKVLGADLSGWCFPRTVTAVWNQGLQPCAKYTYQLGKSKVPIELIATEAHPILVSFGQSAVFKLKVGYEHVNLFAAIARKKDSENGVLRARRVSVADVGVVPCWDLTVDSDDHLFVLANGVIVSNTKHLSGAFKGGKKQFSGMDIVDQLMQSPETFPHKAAVAETSGRVEGVEDAPQGGKFITVAGHKHYALPGYEPTVKVNDQVERGDTLSEGIADAADIVRLRGLGEGRRYYVDRMRQAMTESGLPTPSRLNLEISARGVLDHVRVDNDHGLGDLLPDDIGSYNKISASYHPAADTKLVPVSQAHGHYLQGPALHFSIGTQLTPKMTKHLEAAGITHVPVSDQTPDFVPEMVRLRAVPHNNPDWYSRLHSSYLTTTLSEAGDRSRDADFENNVHFAGPLSKGKNFGKKVKTTGKF